MGDPKKQRKKYKSPSHPWQKARLEDESKLAIEYGLKNKKEIWKMVSILKNFTNQSKKLVTLTTKRAETDKLSLIKKLKSLNLLKENQGFEEILNLTVREIMERRLQTIVHRKGLAKSTKQARQLINHAHIMIGDKKITSPAYLVNIAEESKISFTSGSSFSDPEHPERVVKELKAPKKKTPKEDKKETKEKPKKESTSKEDKKETKEKPKKESKEEKKEVKKEEKQETKK